jgi:hypothetical protein
MSSQNEQQLIQLPPNELNGFEYVSTSWDARIALNVKPDELLKPAFWAHHAVKLKPMDEIRARAEDGTWLGYYVVLDCSRTWAKVHCLAMHQLTSGDVSLTQASEAEVKAFVEAHTVVHRGPHKWSVVRKSDRAVLIEGIGQREEAHGWLDKQARGQVGAPATGKQQEPVTV